MARNGEVRVTRDVNARRVAVSSIAWLGLFMLDGEELSLAKKEIGRHQSVG